MNDHLFTADLIGNRPLEGKPHRLGPQLILIFHAIAAIAVELAEANRLKRLEMQDHADNTYTDRGITEMRDKLADITPGATGSVSHHEQGGTPDA